MKAIVVGAGLAGLVAAEQLSAAGVQVSVLESRDRVGGRVHGIQVAPGAWADAGAAYLGDRHTELRKLLSRFALEVVPTSVDGASRFALRGDPVPGAGRFPPLSAVALGGLFDRLEELATQVRAEAPWLTPGARDLDRQTARQWLWAKPVHPDAELFFPLFTGEMMAADPGSVSALHLGFYLKSGGGIRYLNAFEGGAQAWRVAGGAHQVATRLAASLHAPVRTSTRVHAIEQDGQTVTVHHAGGTERADVAIVALPPALAAGLHYDPALPVPRAGSGTTPGCAVKVHLIYPSALWREHGLSGWSLSADGPLLSTVDDSPPDGQAGVLTAFVTGREAARYAELPARAQRQEAERHARRLFPELPKPSAVHITNWITDPFSRGCYAALFGPGDWLTCGPHLTTRHGRVHWAGTETSVEFFGLMEGAIRSGHSAAARVLDSY